MDNGEDCKAHRDGLYVEFNPRTKYEQFTSSFETMREHEATCPYCGWKERDSWELDDEGELACGSCGREFYYSSEVERYFSTYKQKENG